MNIKQINIDDVIPYHNNPRKNQAIDKVASSIKEYGFQQPIVVDKHMVVIVGHTRLLGAKKFDLNLTGFSSDELDSMFSKEEIEITDPIDAIDEQDYLTNDVKMVQLFYEPGTEKRFREIIDLIKDNNNIDNMSDAVMYCVLNEEKRQKG